MSVSVYVPRAGGINGGAITASGQPVRTGQAACGSAFPFGTVFELVQKDKALELSIPTKVICADRGGSVGNRNIDISLVSPDVRGDLIRARTFGRRVYQVVVNPPYQVTMLITTPKRYDKHGWRSNYWQTI